jgi:Flp pilus assembly protein TadD
VGSALPLNVDYRLLEQRIAASAAVREDLASLRLGTPVDLLTLVLLDEADLAGFAKGAPENTDDRPLLEFAAPLALYADTTDENTRLLREARTTEFPPMTNLPAGLLETRRIHFARTYWAGWEKEEALEQLRKAPLPNPSDIPSQFERAKLLFSLGEVTRAAEDLARLESLQPRDRLIKSYLKAASLLRRLKIDEAVADHGRTQLGDRNPAEALNNVGVFYTRLGIRFQEPAFFDLAVDALEAARGIEPQAYPVINNLANAHFELGRFAEAAQAYQRVDELAPGFAQTHFNLALVYERQGAVDLARREYQTALMLQPAWKLPRLNLQRLDSPGTTER